MTHVGTRLPAHVTALGKVLVAELPPAHRKLWLSEHEFSKLTSQTCTSAVQFSRDLKQYENVGYALDRHEFHYAINGFAAPISDATGSVVAALSLTCLGTSMPEDEQVAIGKRVCDAAEEISLNLHSNGVVGA